MTASPPIVIDQYAPLSHKQIVGQAGAALDRSLRYTPSWVAAPDRRRLAAYIVRAAYLANSARLVLPDDTSEKAVNGYREYGDVAMLVDRLVSAILGDDWQIVVDGADDDLLEGPQLPEMPEEPPADADELVKRIWQGRIIAWRAEAEATVLRWETALASQPRSRLVRDELRAWADRSLFASVVHEGEHDAVGLADAVYVLWPQEGAWPKITVHDPGTYFPAPVDDVTGEFAGTQVLAWEFDGQGPDGTTERLVQRLVWRMVPITSVHVVDDGDGGLVWDGGDRPLLGESDTLHEDGTVTRVMPWHVEGDEPESSTCWYTDGVWRLADLLARNEQNPDLDPFDVAPLWWNNAGQDLRCDTPPVFHVPHTPTGKEQFGNAAVDKIAQAVDDVAQIDGLTISAASYVGKPTVAVAGVDVKDTLIMAPGQVFKLGGEQSKMTVLDLSVGLEKLVDLGAAMQDRTWQNAGMPREVVGRGEATQESGVHLALKLAPYAQMISGARLPREPKYRILLRNVVKHAMIAGVLEPGPVPSCRLQFGSFLPTDRQGAVEMVTKALAVKAISTQTAVSLLVAAGIAIDDAAGEVDRIRAGDAATARDIADATGAESLAADWLGLELPAAPPLGAPTITLPPTPTPTPGA